MARTVEPLTNTKAEKAKPKEKEYSLPDGMGLFLRIKPNGGKVWIFNYTQPYTAKRTNLTIGGYPEISIADARQKRDEYRSLLAKDIDPQQHKAQTTLTEKNRLINTFAYVAEQWKESKVRHVKPLTLSKSWRIVEIYLLPYLKDLPIADVIPSRVKPILDIP